MADLARMLLAEGVGRVIVTREEPRRLPRPICPLVSTSGTVTG